MASVQPVQAVAERQDIHKSCKALEVVVNLLDDYSEAARAIVTLNKKLSKALRDVATVKPTGDIPGNAFNSSANIFDVLSDVDAKFSKFVDKECDVISAEVKKWFKKLAKEERVHDEKIVNANTKIKQAGQAYEKKAKKNAVDAAEEHNRYVNLLNTLGPEISQIKYNHALSVSQRNATVTFQVAATLSRVAEAEWLRSGECIRRFSPLIGQLGEWKAFCEGGWTGPIPGDLPGVDQPPYPPREMQDAVPNDAELGVSPASPRPIQGPDSLRVMSLKPPPTVYDDGSVRSIASLGSFPEPPNHFPIPPLTGSFSSNSATNSPTIQHSTPHGDDAMQIRTSSDVSGSSSDPPFILPRVTESPLEEIAAAPVLTDRSLPSDSSQDHLATPFTTPAQNGRNTSSTVIEGPGANSEDNDDAPSLPVPDTAPQRSSPPASMPPPPTPQSRQQHDPAPSIDSRSNSATGSRNTFRRGDYLDDREFGVDDSPETSPLKAKTLDSPHSRIDRSDTSRSNGNMVAAIRDRYTRATGPASLPPRDIPRLPLSVATIATKYQSETNNEPALSAGRQTRSPTNDLPQRSRDPGPSSPLPQQAQQFPSITSDRMEVPTDDLAHRRQRIEELEELERREHALELRAREREFTARQRERAETLRSRALDGYASDTSRPSRSPFAHRHQSQASLQSQPNTPTLSSNYSYSTTSLLPPGPSGPASPVMQRGTKDVHLPDCQCPACTVARYAKKPLAVHPRPQGREKSKGGWMRRLSMPVVGNAFSSDSKKLATMGGKGINATVLGSLGEAHLSAVSLGRR